jgi:hypothetical protein
MQTPDPYDNQMMDSLNLYGVSSLKDRFKNDSNKMNSDREVDYGFLNREESNQNRFSRNIPVTIVNNSKTTTSTVNNNSNRNDKKIVFYNDDEVNENDVKIPCEFCGKLCDIDSLIIHQVNLFEIRQLINQTMPPRLIFEKIIRPDLSQNA